MEYDLRHSQARGREIYLRSRAETRFFHVKLVVKYSHGDAGQYQLLLTPDAVEDEEESTKTPPVDGLDDHKPVRRT